MTTISGTQPVVPVPDGSVIITPAQMYTEIRDMRTAVEKLTNTVDPALLDLRRDVTTLDKRQAEDHSEVSKAGMLLANRVTVLETKIAAAWAVVGLLAVALGLVAAFLGK